MAQDFTVACASSMKESNIIDLAVFVNSFAHISCLFRQNEEPEQSGLLHA